MSARQEIRDAIAEARRSPDKEPFDIQKFRQVYDVTADIGESPLTTRTVEEYEEQYYLLATEVKTLQEFAEYRRELVEHDAG
ncbi:hypothetical protein D187_007982 [Cystobacter fuscus DSM 2262]|uniref:Uncharacterized protein n=1 Tax=Cystobacter fuscus (strain ATCC 25194 / DSM 2262 / NBRC 100088 / M29) TaxID=1242864 RepID=S9NWT6_CYSF2|nr:hypothetical protein [Cystobacter fuscus]EPX56640.1 hypothetical protein D187_007982 [Cystobacter fuscus DSM 2262]